MYRHLEIDGWDQKKTRDTAVVVCGAGAIGSQVAMMLARIGIGRLIVVDHDFLEEHNIANQLYTPKHLGNSKIDAMKKILEDFDVEYIGIKNRVQNINWNAIDADIFLGCFDNVGARFFMNMIAVTHGKPYIDAGIESYRGQIWTVIPGKTPCLECWAHMFPQIEIKAGCSNNEAAPSTFFTASYAASIQAMQVVKIVFGKPLYPYIAFDLESNVTKPMYLKRNSKCELCAQEWR